MNPGERYGATDPFEHHAGAYVLGALSEHDVADFTVHMERCPACARAVADLAHLPALLDRVPAEQVRRLASRREHDDPAASEEDLGPPPSLLPELLQRAGEVRQGEHRRRQRWRVATGLAVAAAALVVAVVAVEERVGDRPTPQAQPTATSTTEPAPVVLRPVGQQPLTAAVRMQSVAWGTKIELTCAYAAASDQYRPGSGFALVLSDAAGEQQQVATWRAVAGRTLTVPAATSLRRAGIARVDVVRADGQVVLSAAPPTVR